MGYRIWEIRERDEDEERLRAKGKGEGCLSAGSLDKRPYLV
jgi:hypothetical protein